jgi:X-Pro dipeptidyl-peptidase
VSKGILDALNRNSFAVPEPLVAGQEETFTFPLLPQDYVFPAGHRIGLVLLGSYSGYGSQADQNRATISVNVTETLFDLPVVGGKVALRRAGLERITPADVLQTPASEPDGEVEEKDLSDG